MRGLRELLGAGSRRRSAGNRAEERTARRRGARLIPASGAVPGGAADMREEGERHQYLVEHKSTTGSTLRVERRWLEGLSRSARTRGEVPVLTITFNREDGRPVPDGAWVAIPEWLWGELIP